MKATRAGGGDPLRGDELKARPDLARRKPDRHPLVPRPTVAPALDDPRDRRRLISAHLRRVRQHGAAVVSRRKQDRVRLEPHRVDFDLDSRDCWRTRLSARRPRATVPPADGTALDFRSHFGAGLGRRRRLPRTLRTTPGSTPTTRSSAASVRSRSTTFIPRGSSKSRSHWER
jgi:hypothetical protein